MRYLPILILASCASSGEPMAVRFNNAPAVAVANDKQPVVVKPKGNYNLNDLDFFDRSFSDPVTRSLELPGHTRARGVNALDEVPDSTWFTNRIGIRDVTPDEIRKGAMDDDGPEAHKPWTVHSTKPGGTELGFVITDARGVKYLISFDEFTRPELETGAAVVTNRLLWAAGYNVPADSIAYITRQDLVVAPDAVKKDHLGIERGAMDEWDLTHKLLEAWHTPDGTYRVFVSKYLGGTPLGGGPPTGVREDDPNDKIPHQDRRDQRGQLPLFAWVDHIDLVQSNTLDMYVADPANPAAHYVVHYLVDFGKSLGAMALTDKYIREGYNYSFDWVAHLADFFTLGLLPRPWQCRLVKGPPTGVSPTFSADYFDPEGWKPDIPVPAFEDADRFDAFWGAKLVARFTKEQIHAAVEAARFTDPAAVEYITNTLVARQQATLRTWFDKVNPLDQFNITSNALCFTDLAVQHGLAASAVTKYELASFDAGNNPIGSVTIPAAGAGPTCTHDVIVSTGSNPYTMVRISTERAEFKGTTYVHLSKDGAGAWRVIGVWRI